MLLSERLGLPACARELATAGLHALERAFPDQGPDQDISMSAGEEDDQGQEDDTDVSMDGEGTSRAGDQRAKRAGRLWGNLFAYALEDAKYEVSAYGLSLFMSNNEGPW